MNDDAVEFTPTQADYVVAIRAHYRWALRKSLRRSFGILTLISAICAVAMALRDDNPWMLICAPLLVAVAGVAVVLLAWLNYALIPRRAARILAQNSGSFASYRDRWTDAGLVCESALTRTDRAWSDYYSWIEAPGTFLLLVNECTYQFIPKRVLSAEQQDRLQTLLVEHGTKRA